MSDTTAPESTNGCAQGTDAAACSACAAVADWPTGKDDARPCRVEPDLGFKKELAELGVDTFNQCFQCATCTTTCELSPDTSPFPRKEMIALQWGLKDRLLRDPDIWLCHYCGSCTQRCPRGANPAETMMALRRYAITRYDRTGLSRRLYRSRWWELGAVAAVAAVVVGLFALAGSFTPARMVTSHVELDTFIPMLWVHAADWIMAAVLTFFLVTNSVHMARLILDGQKPPLAAYLGELKVLLKNAAVQPNWRKCDRPTRWKKHLLLVSGYTLMFTLVMIFLPWLQVNGAQFTWISILGYYAAFAIIFYAADALIGRLRKRDEIHRFSHESDWMFLILLLLTGVTGILVNVFRMQDLPLPTYFTYVIHLAIAVPMLVVEVPFMKWSHLAYRPLAIYLKAVKERAAQMTAAPVRAQPVV